MIIRKGKMSDAIACNKLSNTPELVGPGGMVPRALWFRAYVKEKQPFFVAEDKKIIGYVAGEMLIGRGAILHLIAVQKEYRKKGVGTQLMKAFEKECRKRKAVWLITYGYDSKGPVTFFLRNKFYRGSGTIEFVKWLK